jgi:hypothetical protein
MEHFNSKELKIWIRRNKVVNTCGMKILVPEDDGTKFYFPWSKDLHKWNNLYNKYRWNKNLATKNHGNTWIKRNKIICISENISLAHRTMEQTLNN